MRPIVNYPAAQIRGPSAASGQLSTSATTVVPVPSTQSGGKPSFCRVSISSGAAYVKLGQFADTSTTVTTSDAILTSNEALWLNTLGLAAVAIRQTAPGGVAFASVSACEEGALAPPTVASVV